MADDKLVSAYKASRTKAPAKNSKGKGNSNAAAILAGARRSTIAPVEQAPAPEKELDWWEQTMQGVGEAFEKPVIKQIIDLISAPGAAITTSLNNVQKGSYDAEQRGIQRAQAKGQEGTGDFGNRWQTFLEQANPAANLGHIAAGIGEGAQLAVGDREGVKYTHDIIHDAQEYSGIDTNSSESKWVQGLGGLAVDIALDPLSYATGGGKAAAAIKGGVRGAKQSKSESAMSRVGEEIAPGVESSRMANIKKQAEFEVAKYNKAQAEIKQGKEVRKQTKKLTPEQKAAFFIENIATLQPAVAKAILKDEEVLAKVSDKVDVETFDPAKRAEIVNKLSDTAEEAASTSRATDGAEDAALVADEAAEMPGPVDVSEALDDFTGTAPKAGRKAPAAPVRGLAEFKPPTMVEDVFNKLGTLRSTTKSPVYDAKVLNAVNTHLKARPDYIDKVIEEVVPAAPKTKFTKAEMESPDVIAGGVQAIKPGKGTSANLAKAIAAQNSKLKPPAQNVSDAYDDILNDLKTRKGTMVDEATGKKVTYKKAAEAIEAHLNKATYDTTPNFEALYNLPTEVLKEHGFIKVTGDGTYNVSWGKTANEAVPMPKVENKFEEFGAKPGEIPDVAETVKKLKAYIRGEQKLGGNPTFRIPNPAKPDQVLTLTKEDFLKALSQGNANFKAAWNSKDLAEFRVFKQSDEAPIPAPQAVDNVVENATPEPVKEVIEEVAPTETRTRIERVKNPKALTDEDYIKLGVKPEHVALLRNGVKLEDIVDEISVGDIKAIAKDMRDGTISQKIVDEFAEHAGTADPKTVADFIETLSKTPAFQEAAKELGVYGSVRTGKALDPTVGVSGHGALAKEMPLKGFTERDILAAKTPASPEQTRAYLEAKYEEAAINLASHKDGVKLRALADKAFEGTVDVQRREAGPLRTLTGASTKGPNTTAKYEKLYNTHSGMWRMDYIIKQVRSMKYASRGQMDEAIMATLTDVDARLRLAGFDQHLSNMATVGDKVVVRLAPSDVLKVLTQSDRIKYIWGNKNFDKGSELNEFLPTTLLDIGEVLVRSATKLTPEGQLDQLALVNKAIHTLNGTYSTVAPGQRVIKNNLDVFTRQKNDRSILAALDKANETEPIKTAFTALYNKAATVAEKDQILAIAMKDPKFKKLSEKRLTTVANDLLARFTKGMADGKASPITELININMRNAALMGGTVAKKVGEASAEYSAKVLESLEKGTQGSHLSALVAKPPYQTTDPAIKAVLAENRTAAQLSVATAEEVKHAETLNRNVTAAESVTAPKNAKEAAKAQKKASKESAKVNREAYQKDPELESELAKPLNEIDNEKVFDLAKREQNKDMLFRLFGTSRFFNRRTGIPISFDVIAGSTHASSLLMTGFHEILRDLRRKNYSKEQLRVAFNSLKQGPPADEIAAELNAVLSAMFNADSVNFLSRNGVGVDHFNTMLKAVKFEDRFRVPVDATPAEMMNAWKQWDVVDVEDFFSKMMGAMVKTAEDVSMGASFSKHFGSSVPKPGYSKVIDTTDRVAHGTPKHNPFLDLIDQTLYYPDEIMGEFVHIGRLITESRSFTPGTNAHLFVNKLMDPIISNLKMTQTTLKPGHHVMSVIGDTWRNNLALATIGMTNPAHQVKLYGESARILKAAIGDIEELSSFQKFQHAQGITTDLKISKDGQSGSSFFANIGGGGRVGYQNLYDIMQANGVALPPHLGGMSEDILTEFNTHADNGTRAPLEDNAFIRGTANTVQKVTEGMDRLVNPIKPKFGMKNPYSLNKFTAHRDTWTRGALFLGAMRSKQFKNVDEATKYAAEFVRKWAPTAQDLGAGEAKYLRRAIFYYTWIRGMVPRVIEATMMRPGIAIIPNRAMYNLAIANGLDPASVGDPFPPDQLFPSWYTERVIGPQWVSEQGDLWGLNPTGPVGDVLNSLGSNIKPKDFLSIDATTKTLGTIANMSSPFIKAPLEAGFGRTLETGAPIDDRLQYLQDYVGQTRIVSRMLGKELYPSVGPDGEVGFKNRTESKFREGMTDEELTANMIAELGNYGSGLGLTNYTSDSAQKSAEFQERDKLIKAQREADRFK